MTYIYVLLTPRLSIAIALASVLSADTVWIWADRDEDFLSRINPWVTLILSILVMIWGVIPEKHKFTNAFHEVLWLVHGWWVVLFVRLTFVPQPAQVDGWERVSWIFIYGGMSIGALGLWFAARRNLESRQ